MSLLDTELRPLFPATVDFDAAQAQLEAAGLGDGLPLVPPTQQRLAAMLEGVRRRHDSRGVMPPLFGDLLPEDVAYQCVLAGCRPGAAPLVLEAAAACLEPEFNLLGVTTTTGSAAVAMLVHGPLATALDLNAAGNCLGPGNRPNATIGRALGLVLRNIAGARPGEGDMATVGQPGKYTFCFAESTEPLLPPLPARRGFGATASAVTVLGVSGTAEVLPDPARNTPQSVLDPLVTIIKAANATTGASLQSELPEQVFILPPEAARLIVDGGWDLAAIQAHVHTSGVTASPADVHPIIAGGPGIKMAYLALWGGGSRTVTRPIDA
jgi:hypothetical protein